MARTTTAQVPFASATVASGDPETFGPWLAILDGVSIFAKVTNGATGPTTGARLILQVADDSSGTNPEEEGRYDQADLAALAVTAWRLTLAPGADDGGNYSHYRVGFAAPGSSSVTASARASASSY